jgi:hypothetical protein
MLLVEMRMKLKYREDRNRWEIYVLDGNPLNRILYAYCMEHLGERSMSWDNYGCWFFFFDNKLASYIKLRFGI